MSDLEGCLNASRVSQIMNMGETAALKCSCSGSEELDSKSQEFHI